MRGLAVGLGSLMEPAVRADFYSALGDWSGYSVKASSWADLPEHPRYVAETTSPEETSYLSMIPVDSMAQAAVLIWLWIAKSEPFILVCIAVWSASCR